MSRCLVSFGSNVGDRHQLLHEAANRISEHPAIHAIRCSRIFTTPPVGGPDGQDSFLNAVALVDTDLSTDGVLELLQQVEQSLGRIRKQRWDRRTIDLDLVLFGDFVGASFRLKLPHPRYTARAFVLAPAIDVAADWIDPRFGWSLRQLYEHLRAAPPSVAMVGGGPELRQAIFARIAKNRKVSIRRNTEPKQKMAVVGHAPGPVFRIGTSDDDQHEVPIVPNQPWVSDFVPDALGQTPRTEASLNPCMPRLIARLQRTTPENRWPSPQILYRNGWNWPEYRLEVDDLDWAAGEILAAIESMQCQVQPVTNDGSWL